MSTSLEKYLTDHLAGAAFAIDLLGALGRKHETDPFAEQLRTLLEEITRDRDELVRIADRLGIERGGMKEGMARVLEKLSRPKLVSNADDDLSSFEACETLALGIRGKISLWNALSKLTGIETIDVDLERLKRSAEDQYQMVEKIRLDMAPVTLGAVGQLH